LAAEFLRDAARHYNLSGLQGTFCMFDKIAETLTPDSFTGAASSIPTSWSQIEEEIRTL